MKSHRLHPLQPRPSGRRGRFVPSVAALALSTIVILSACSPAVTASPVAIADATATPTEATVTTGATVASTPEATLAPTQPGLPVATSRGSNLHATDPGAVSLASGGLQLVEFFRFT